MTRPPVLVTAPAALPVSLASVKAHLRVDHSDDDDTIKTYIEAAVAHLDGYAGILGRCLVTQTWRQDYDSFSREMRLPFEATEVEAITWRNREGQIATVATANYALDADSAGSYVRFQRSFDFPRDLHEARPVAITFLAGFGVPPSEESSDPNPVPGPIRSAILLMVGDLYRYRETARPGGTPQVEMSLSVDRLLTPYRRWSF